MIRSIKIHGLLDQYNITLPIHKNVTVLTGLNGSGKTILAKAAVSIINGGDIYYKWPIRLVMIRGDYPRICVSKIDSDTNLVGDNYSKISTAVFADLSSVRSCYGCFLHIVDEFTGYLCKQFKCTSTVVENRVSLLFDIFNSYFPDLAASIGEDASGKIEVQFKSKRSNRNLDKIYISSGALFTLSILTTSLVRK
ncbi:MAG: hypothetical protein GY861_21150 [bacterium]|nr:hypothetical protein [bacterium]